MVSYMGTKICAHIFFKRTEFPQGKCLTLWMPDTEKNTVIQLLKIVLNHRKLTLSEAGSQTRGFVTLGSGEA